MGKQAGFLDHVAHTAAQSDEIGFADVLPIHQHGARGGFDHAIHGAQEGGFAGAASAQDSGDCALVQNQGNTVEQEASLRNSETDVSEFDRWSHARLS